jgi:hypothetical protein
MAVSVIAALADSLLPAAQVFIDKITASDQRATVAAQVAADPNAPHDVKQAATNVAAQALDEKASHEKAALAAMSGKQPHSGGAGGAGTAAAILALLWLL